MQRHPILLSWSGGKDAAWTLHRLQAGDAFEVVGLLTTLTDGYDRIAMHGIRREILLAQAAATGLPLVESRIPQQCDNERYEAAFAAALVQARERWPGLETIAFGDLFLADVRAWREALCTRLGWRIETPLFGADTAALANQMITGGLRATLCCVDTTQLAAEFSGREFDARLLAELPPAVDPCGERGEFHTCVHAGPMLRHPLALRAGERVLRDERFAYVDLEWA
ncbi:ATP-binding protein [Lysobacter niabensis]|uniref:Dph6-related ATP pyrophosphatase n=1 Tax=Agrilutibacter niabensis TaxID=380628 RepID=UPI0036198AB4